MCYYSPKNLQPAFVGPGGGNQIIKNKQKSYSALEPFMSYGPK